jgi:23S rRNA pseudouridine955/2504/2580 synthase
METRTYRIAATDDGQRLDRWCKTNLKDVPYAALQKLLRKGDIRVDGKKAEGAARLTAGQEITLKGFRTQDASLGDAPAVRREKPPKTRAMSAEQVAKVQSWVLYKDAEMIIINKPFGIAVQGGSGVKNHVDGLLPALQFEYDAPPKLVHRLDRDTSGVLVLARTREAAASLQKLFSSKKLQKTYLAVCAKVPKAYSGEIRSRMEKSVRGKDSREVVALSDEGKLAITRYDVKNALARKLCLMELEPVTGRTHQLRVHMAELGCPILGDGKYGGTESFIGGTVEIPRKLHLHAWKITLPTRRSGVRTFEAPLPEHMQKTLDLFELEL